LFRFDWRIAACNTPQRRMNSAFQQRDAVADVERKLSTPSAAVANKQKLGVEC
jgi:hypothetical protein